MAMAFNNIGVACLIAGLIAPGVTGLNASVALGSQGSRTAASVYAATGVIWVIVAYMFHMFGRTILGRLR